MTMKMKMKGKAKAKPKTVEYCVWNDNLSEMKHFCRDCTITFETCCVDDYFCLRVYDDIKEKEVTVALWDYVVRLDEDTYTVVSNEDFTFLYEVIKEDESSEDKSDVEN